MSIVKCPPAQRMPMSGLCSAWNTPMSAITSVSPRAATTKRRTSSALLAAAIRTTGWNARAASSASRSAFCVRHAGVRRAASRAIRRRGVNAARAVKIAQLLLLIAAAHAAIDAEEHEQHHAHADYVHQHREHEHANFHATPMAPTAPATLHTVFTSECHNPQFDWFATGVYRSHRESGIRAISNRPLLLGRHEQIRNDWLTDPAVFLTRFK